MDMRKLAILVEQSGVSQADIRAFGHIPFSTEQLVNFATALITGCAEVQNARSAARHGYDKHSDAQALLLHFGIEPSDRVPS